MGKPDGGLVTAVFDEVPLDDQIVVELISGIGGRGSVAAKGDRGEKTDFRVGIARPDEQIVSDRQV